MPQLRVFDGHVMLWPRSVNEKAEAVLSVAGAPLTPEEIQERIGEDYSLVGIRNQLTADDALPQGRQEQVRPGALGRRGVPGHQGDDRQGDRASRRRGLGQHHRHQPDLSATT
ncbi:hypothetical protein [Nonomuraea dietziae]|uniref:hypothetical protein n=1 Tax=Nonomuraea dietziae TaxID=65515 RepID=UPI0031D544B6